MVILVAHQVFEKETTGMFNLSAEKYNFIGIYPQGDFFYDKSDQNYSFISSWNELSSSKKELVQIERSAYQML